MPYNFFALTFWDVILSPIYLFIIFFIARIIKSKNIEKNSAYEYYIKGLSVKIIGGIGVCLVYSFYYGGGDTVAFFWNNLVLSKLFFKSPVEFFSILIKGFSLEKLYLWDSFTGYPEYLEDSKTFFVNRFTSIITLISFRSYIVTTILLACLSYSGIWRMYLVFCEEFPELKKKFAIAFLFIPSVVFWGSGLLKDTITIAAIGWYIYGFYYFFIKKSERKFMSIIYLIISSYIMLSLRPFILFALLPSSLFWIIFGITYKIKNSLFKYIAIPVFLLIFIGSAYLILDALSQQLGEYSLDRVLDRAVEVQQDLKKDYYGGKTFDIGDFDPTISGILKKAPAAIIAALFRPFLWDVENPVMLVSALENTFIILLVLQMLKKIKLSFLPLINKSPILVFSMIFSLFFAFAVGLSTPNFGSLVRYKIPAIPFYLASLFILNYLYELKYQQKEIKI